MDFHIAIIGAGPSGLFGAFIAGQLGMSVCIIDANKHIGGQCYALYPDKPIYDIAGFVKILSRDLVDNLFQQAKSANPIYMLGTKVQNIERHNDGTFNVVINDKKIHVAVVIIAIGCGVFLPNKPPINKLQEYEGISAFYSIEDVEICRNKNVTICGGGDSAADWAVLLHNVAKSVTMVHRRKEFRCNQKTLDSMISLKLDLITPYQLADIDGNDKQISHVTLVHVENNNTLEIKTDILLMFYGLITNTAYLKDWGLDLLRGKVIVDHNHQTNIPGVYGIGDITHYEGRQNLICIGFAEAAKALYHCYSRVFGGKKLHFQYSTSRGINS